MFSKPGSGPAVLRKVTQEASKVDPARRRDFLKRGLWLQVALLRVRSLRPP